MIIDSSYVNDKFNQLIKERETAINRILRKEVWINESKFLRTKM